MLYMLVIHLCSHGFMHKSDLESEHVIPVVFAIHIKNVRLGPQELSVVNKMLGDLSSDLGNFKTHH